MTSLTKSRRTKNLRETAMNASNVDGIQQPSTQNYLPDFLSSLGKLSRSILIYYASIVLIVDHIDFSSAANDLGSQLIDI